eukprot:361278-Chlamydomonas_euryale.AAC.5
MHTGLNASDLPGEDELLSASASLDAAFGFVESAAWSPVSELKRSGGFRHIGVYLGNTCGKSLATC